MKVITAENLGKKYILRHQQDAAYRTLRESLYAGLGRVKNRLLGRGGKFASKEEFWALKDVSFSVEPGERLGVIGRNGAGKSTLLKVLSRITVPSTGRVRLNGRVASLLEVGTGFHPELTGRENIFLNGAVLGMKRREIIKKFDEIVAFAEVERFLDTPVKRYSSGMYVRLAFAVAAHLEPEILLVDEVLAVGDAGFQEKCLGKMNDIARQGRTLLFVSHNMGAIKKLCNRVLLIRDGRIAYEGAPEPAIEQYFKDSLAKKEQVHADLSDHARRAKGMNPYLKRVVLKNAGGEPVNTFTQGETVTIEIRHDVPGDIIVSTSGFTIVSNEGIRVGGLNTFMTLPPPHRLPNAGTVRFTLPPCLLTPGKYYLNVSVGSHHKLLDQVDEAIDFNIEQEDIYGTGYLLTRANGLVSIMDAKTEITPDER